MKLVLKIIVLALFLLHLPDESDSAKPRKPPRRVVKKDNPNPRMSGGGSVSADDPYLKVEIEKPTPKRHGLIQLQPALPPAPYPYAPYGQPAPPYGPAGPYRPKIMVPVRRPKLTPETVIKVV